MSNGILEERVILNTDWATVLFVVCFVLVAITRSVFEIRFLEFVRLAVSDKYIKVYRDSSNMMSWFNVALFLLHLISFSFLIQLLLSYFGFAQKDDWVLYIRIFTLLGVFVLAKFLVEKIIAACFSIDELVDQFNLQKVSYRTYIGMFLLPVNIILYYTQTVSISLVLTLIFILLTINIVTYLFSLKNYQNAVVGKLFYFILYLCALEIAPYYFLYYWFTKS